MKRAGDGAGTPSPQIASRRGHDRSADPGALCCPRRKRGSHHYRSFLMWLKAKTPIKVSSTKTIAEGETFEAEEHLGSPADVDELKAIGAVEETAPPPAPPQAETKKK